MTALCGGGSSSPQSGVGGVLTLTAAGIEIFINRVLHNAEFASTAAAIIAGIVDIDIAAYCATDPPADPGITAADVALAIAFPAPPGAYAAQQKILQWFESQYWYAVCQCNSVTTPTPPTPSSPGPIISNPGIPANTAVPCWNVTVPWAAKAHNVSTGNGFADLTSVALPPGLTYTGEIQGSPVVVNNQFVVLPAGLTRLAMTMTLDQDIQSSGLYVQAQWMESQDIPPTIIGEIFDTIFIYPTAPNTPFATAPAYPSYAATSAIVITNADTVDHSGTLNVQYWCTGGATQLCNCAPDPLLEGELAQILQYVQSIYAALPVPLTSFAEATAHTGLTGGGTLALDTADVAVKVILTSIPTWQPQSAGTPIRYFGAGHMTFSTAEGSYAAQGIHYAEQVFTIPTLGYTLDYNIGDGITATIVELQRGP